MAAQPIVCVSRFFDYPQAKASLLSSVPEGTNIRVLESTNDVYSVEVKQLIASCEILLTDQTQTPFFTPFLGKQLKWIHVTTAGVNLLMENLEFIKYLESRGDNLPLISRTSYTFNMTVYCLGHICARHHFFSLLQDQQKQKIWKRTQNQHVSTQTVGILGVGDVGSGIAAACKQLGMKTVGFSSSSTVAEHFDEVYPGNLNEILKQCNFLINALPSSPKTRNLLSGDVLQTAQSKCPVFINIGRGDVISEDSVLKALELNWIKEAILDVFEVEPLPPTNKLWNHPKVTVTPHISGGPLDEDMHVYIINSFCNNLKLYLDDKKPKLLVDHKKGY